MKLFWTIIHIILCIARSINISLNRQLTVKLCSIHKVPKNIIWSWKFQTPDEVQTRLVWSSQMETPRARLAHSIRPTRPGRQGSNWWPWGWGGILWRSCRASPASPTPTSAGTCSPWTTTTHSGRSPRISQTLPARHRGRNFCLVIEAQTVPLSELFCRLRSIAAHRDHFILSFAIFEVNKYVAVSSHYDFIHFALIFCCLTVAKGYYYSAVHLHWLQTSIILNTSNIL